MRRHTAPALLDQARFMAMGNNGVKVTYIETQFVTSDAAGFKSLVQRLTGPGSGALPSEAQTQDYQMDEAVPGQSFLPPELLLLSVLHRSLPCDRIESDPFFCRVCLQG